jgi:phospholipid N-methyltransferase
LLTIDTNSISPHFLNGKFTDSRLQAVTGSRPTVRQIMADRGFRKRRLSFLPAFHFDPSPRRRSKIAGADPQRRYARGAFLVYQFSPKVRQFIAPHFERIDKGFEWRNIPPATLFWAWKD